MNSVLVKGGQGGGRRPRASRAPHLCLYVSESPFILILLPYAYTFINNSQEGIEKKLDKRMCRVSDSSLNDVYKMQLLTGV